jgi:hypothetical protein
MDGIGGTRSAIMLEGSTRRRRMWSTIVLVLAVVAFFAVLEGRNILHDLREQRRVETDPHVRGKVIHAQKTGDQIGEEPLMELTVEFKTLDDRPVRTTTIERVGIEDAAQLLGNPEVDVWYAPNNPSDVVIRWRERPK